MSTVLWVAFGAALFLASIVAHEAAHAVVLWRLGFPIASAGLGLPFPPVLRLQPTARRPFALTLSPWLVGAYVMPHREDEDAIEAMPYRQVAWYSGVGVMVNLTLAGGFLTVLSIVYGSSWAATGVGAGVTVGLWVARRPLCRYVLPVLGVPMLGVVAYGMVDALAAGQATGIVGLGRVLGEVTSLHQALLIAALLNIGVAVFNLIPLYPLDGGRIADAAIRHLAGDRPARWFRYGAVPAVVLLLLASVFSDVAWAFA